MVVRLLVTTSAEPSPNEADRRAKLEALFAAHAAQVFAFARRRASRSEAEDVVSETFLVAWRRLDAVPDRSLPWLLGVARRVLANRRRADSRRAALRSRLESGEPAVEAAAPSQSDGGRVSAALAALPPAERDAITLLAWDGLTPDEAAIVLGCSRATFYVRVHRARRKLAGGLDAAMSSTTKGSVEP